jgi:hypothetical protein
MPNPPPLPEHTHDRIESFSDSRSIVCADNAITIKDGDVQMELVLDSTEDTVLMQQADSKLTLGVLQHIGCKVKDLNTGETTLAGAVRCEMEKIYFEIQDTRYYLDLQHGEDEDVLQVKGNDLVLNPMQKLVYSYKDSAGKVTEKSSITCTKDSIEFKIGANAYTCDFTALVGKAANKPLVPIGKELKFADLVKIGTTTRKVSPNGTVTVEDNTAATCTATVITLRTRSPDKSKEYTYDLDLSNAVEDAPLVKKGNKIVFGTPITKLGNIVLTPTVPDILDAKDGVLYFIYDEGTPYVP